MRWVRDHIAAFGGNGSDITLFGHSAGANSVINHLVRPASYPLYNKVSTSANEKIEREQNILIASFGCAGHYSEWRV